MLISNSLISTKLSRAHAYVYVSLNCLFFEINPKWGVSQNSFATDQTNGKHSGIFCFSFIHSSLYI